MVKDIEMKIIRHVVFLFKKDNVVREYPHVIICIFDSDLVWRMQLMIIKGLKFMLCV